MAFDFVNHLQELDAPAKTGEAGTQTLEVEPKVAAAPALAPAETETDVPAQDPFVETVDARMAKIAQIIADETDDQHAQLFKNCVSACFHYKTAGYTIAEREEEDESGETVKVAYDRAEDPNEFMAMCYNMYKDILSKQG